MISNDIPIGLTPAIPRQNKLQGMIIRESHTAHKDGTFRGFRAAETTWIPKDRTVIDCAALGTMLTSRSECEKIRRIDRNCSDFQSCNGTDDRVITNMMDNVIFTNVERLCMTG